MITVVLALIGLVFSIYALQCESRKGSVAMIYWISSIYLFEIPYFVDSLSLFFGFDESLQVVLNNSDPNYSYKFENTNMALMGLFVLFFNFSFFAGSRIVNYRDVSGFIGNKDNYLKTIVVVGWLFLILFLTLYEGSWFQADFNRKLSSIEEYSVLFILLSSAAAYHYSKNKSYFITIISILPSVFLSFVLSERPYLMSAIGVVFCGSSSHLMKSKKGIFYISIMGVIVVFLSNLVRTLGRDVDGLTVLALLRDSSTNVLYFIFSDAGYYNNLTDFKAITYLFLTALMPSTFFGARNFDAANIPNILAQNKFGWSEGTIHPTLYGWAYIDMGFFALFFSFLLGWSISYIGKKLVIRRPRFYSVYVASVSMFLFVAFRGSPQVGFGKAFYIMILGVLLYHLYYLLFGGRLKKL